MTEREIEALGSGCKNQRRDRSLPARRLMDYTEW